MVRNDSINFKASLWKAADALRSNMDAAEYKHTVLGLIFLKYISDVFEEKYNELVNDEYADPEDRDEYLAENVFWVPEKARWAEIKSNAKQPEIGQIIDDAMYLIEKENDSLKDVLTKNYARADLDKRKLGQLIDLISSIGLGDSESRAKDVLGQVYEYFLGQFADAEGKKGGQFYTPKSIVNTLVEILKPYKGRVYDPACGSGGMFVQSEKFIEKHQGRKDDIAIYGQESNPTTWRLCKMNLAIRGIDNSGIKLGDTFHDDKHPDLRADYVIANPPFNISDWGGDILQEDKRWITGISPPAGNANFAWVQHMIYHLRDKGIAGIVLANGSMSSNTSSEGKIREELVRRDMVDAIVALPSQLFYNTMIPACLWFVRKNKEKRKGETLFIDARNMGHMTSRRNRELSEDEVKKLGEVYDKWQEGKNVEELGFAKSATTQEIEKQGFVLTPGRYVGIPEEKDDGEPFEEKMARLTKELAEQMKEGKRLDEEIKENLKGIGFKIK